MLITQHTTASSFVPSMRRVLLVGPKPPLPEGRYNTDKTLCCHRYCNIFLLFCSKMVFDFMSFLFFILKNNTNIYLSSIKYFTP